MTMSATSYALFLLAAAYTSLAATANDFPEVISRAYTNPDPGNDPKNIFGYIPQNKYAIAALSMSSRHVLSNSSRILTINLYSCFLPDRDIPDIFDDSPPWLFHARHAYRRVQ